MRAGSVVTHVPRGETDLSVDIPVVTETVHRSNVTTASRWETRVDDVAARTRKRRKAAAAALGSIAAAGLLVAVVSHYKSSATNASVSSEPASAVSSAPEAPIAMAPLATDSVVVIRVETNPPAAHVFLGGEDRGSTPVDVRLPRGQGRTSMDIRRAGFATLTQEIVPDQDQRLLLTLAPIVLMHRPLPTAKPSAMPAAPPPPVPTTSAAAQPASTGFHRFD
jgi:hypothetical protein